MEFCHVRDKPEISIIVVCFRMQRQIRNTVLSLSATYQRGVSANDYEVLLLENTSDQQLSQQEIDSLPENFRYVLRQETSSSPAAAINEGFSMARGDTIGLMIDGAYMLSPGVISFARMAMAASPQVFVTVPTYHLGSQDQSVAVQEGYDLKTQEALLASISWPEEGYKLFQISGLCGANPRGFFASILESNCYFASREAFAEVGYADESFQQPGGGSLNLDMTLKLGSRPGSVYFSLGGEGAFHQYHGGVTTSASREGYIEGFDEELHRKWEGKFHYLARNPIVLGSFNEFSHPSLHRSSELMQRRFKVCKANNWPVWEDAQEQDVT